MREELRAAEQRAADAAREEEHRGRVTSPSRAAGGELPRTGGGPAVFRPPGLDARSNANRETTHLSSQGRRSVVMNGGGSAGPLPEGRLADVEEQPSRVHQAVGMRDARPEVAGFPMGGGRGGTNGRGLGCAAPRPGSGAGGTAPDPGLPAPEYTEPRPVGAATGGGPGCAAPPPGLGAGGAAPGWRRH